MKSKILLVIISVFLSGPIYSQKVFTSVDSLWDYAASKSISIQSGYLKVDQAQKAKLAAILSIPDPSGDTYLSYTHNTKLAVNLFPAETFGGEAGTYKEVKTGVPYVTSFVRTLNVKLLNLEGWENLKMSKLNIKSSVSENRATLKALFEDIATTYYNIVSLQEQLASTIQNVTASDSLLQITQNKYNAGFIKQQDVNSANINYLTTKESKNQIEFLIKQQYLALKVLCDIPEQEDIVIANKSSLSDLDINPFVELNNLALTNSVYKEKIALSTWRQQKYAQAPSISFFQSSTSQQNNTRGRLFDNSVKWIPSSYLGLKLSLPLPSANKMSEMSKAKYDYLIAKKNAEQQKIQSELEVDKLRTAYDKALSQAVSNKQIFLLRKENYGKYLNQYKEGLVGLEQTIDKFNEMVNSNYDLVSSQVTALAARTKIDINNRIK